MEVQPKPRPLVGRPFREVNWSCKKRYVLSYRGSNFDLGRTVLDVEIQINRRPLSYMEDDLELPTLTPNTFLFQRTSDLPESEPWRIGETDLRKRAKYLITCKNGLWRRWKREYLKALRERHSLIHNTPKYVVKAGDVVIIKTDDKNRGKWPLAIVERLFPGPDGVT